MHAGMDQIFTFELRTNSDLLIFNQNFSFSCSVRNHINIT